MCIIHMGDLPIERSINLRQRERANFLYLFS
ncbi:hypothetical protein BAE44_0019134 [Dichanthelium oligosanthes]|uniref:Uncharacterized protein n=1 Tax=Dichanthelium oligosanthes TaxID=888268 RepID=A0A1E5V429_9POAL|nr:hypothetical protein BAE44_0019134 [Dichanthelium oligosanthes]